MTLRPCSRAVLATGSLMAVALISPACSAARRREPPPYSLSVTSSRVNPSRCSASVTVASLSEPNELTPTTPPFRSAAGLQRLGAAAAAAHVDDVDLQSVRRIETAGLGHPQRQDGVDWLGDSDFQLGHVGGGRHGR